MFEIRGVIWKNELFIETRVLLHVIEIFFKCLMNFMWNIFEYSVNKIPFVTFTLWSSNVTVVSFLILFFFNDFEVSFEELVHWEKSRRYHFEPAKNAKNIAYFDQGGFEGLYRIHHRKMIHFQWFFNIKIEYSMKISQALI